MTKAVSVLWAALVLTLGGCTAAARQNAPDVILFDGKIFTADAARPYVQALAVKGERIVATGTNDEITALADRHTSRIDLGGRTMIPGINDAHIHLEVSPADTVELQLQDADPTWSDVKRALASALAKARPGAPLLAYVGPAIFHDVAVNRDSLDESVPDHPVILASVTGHADILNSRALAWLGIRDGQADPAGGRFERSTAGRLTGVVREYAALYVTRRIADATSDEAAVAELRKTLDQAASFGITSLQDMSNAMTPERIATLLAKVPTPIRVRVIRMPGSTPAGRDIQEGPPTPRSSNPLITISGTKWMLDGTPVERTFETRDSARHGADVPFETIFSDFGVIFPPAEIRNMLQDSLGRPGDQLMVHVFGYNSAAAMLRAMQATGGRDVWAGRRVRFEHGDGLFPDLVPRAKEMGVIVVQNPSHLDVVTIFPRLSLKRAQPLRTLLSAGIPVALGSDGPMNPYLNILFASTHPDRPSERITREQAVVAYTLTSAYAEFAEQEKGSLETGKLADLAVLSRDIFTVDASELPKTRSVLTMVGGAAAYDSGILRWSK